MYQFTLQYLDDDQSIMWNAALEYSKGSFYEPYCFGQNYNTMLESLLAIPLIKAGLSYAFSLTFIMSLLTILPFIFLSQYLNSTKNYDVALIAMAFPLLLPPEFGMLTAISRGAITGIFLSFLGVFFFIKNVKGKFFWFSFFSMLGLVANPNCILLFFPVALYSLYQHYKLMRFYLLSLAGAIIPFTLWWLAQNFYESHPEYLVHGAWKLDFDTGRIIPFYWYRLFGNVTPVFWYSGLVLFPLLFILIYFGYRQQNKAAMFFAGSTVLLVLASLTSNKVHDGTDSVFYSCGRMFLAIPLVLTLTLIQLKVGKKVVVSIALLGSICFLVKLFYTGSVVTAEVLSDNKNMYVVYIPTLKKKCELLKKRAAKINARLIVIHRSVPEKHVLNYACPCLVENFPESIEPELDRRTWRLKSVDSEKFENILLTGILPGEVNTKLKEYSGFIMIPDTLLTIGITENKLPTSVLLENIGFAMRKH